MHGLVFVTWEKYIAERFGHEQLNLYRATIGETTHTAPIASRVYDDAMLIAGVQALCHLTGIAASSVLREYGRYFIINGLTSHLCSYLLTKVNNARELLLMMRDGHAQMRRTPDGLTPPLFAYEAAPDDPEGLILIYDSPRKLCPLLLGAIEGAAIRFGEQALVTEQCCMKRGADICRFEIHFQAPSTIQLISREKEHYLKRQQDKQHFADLVLKLLPKQEGSSLEDLQRQLQHIGMHIEQIRPRIIFEALRHLQYAGLITSTANRPGDILLQRRYWRTPTEEDLREHPTYTTATMLRLPITQVLTNGKKSPKNY